MLTDDLIIYLKTTDTCQLNCAHCYTYGSNAAKGFFDPQKTINFLKNMKEARPQVSSGNITFHGGEPFLCPTNLMFDVWNETKGLWPSVWWSIQSNLTLELTQGRKDVLDFPLTPNVRMVCPVGYEAKQLATEKYRGYHGDIR